MQFLQLFGNLFLLTATCGYLLDTLCCLFCFFLLLFATFRYFSLLFATFCYFLLLFATFCCFLLLFGNPFVLTATCGYLAATLRCLLCYFLLLSATFCYFLLLSATFCYFLLLFATICYFCYFLLLSATFATFLLPFPAWRGQKLSIPNPPVNPLLDTTHYFTLPPCTAFHNKPLHGNVMALHGNVMARW